MRSWSFPLLGQTCYPRIYFNVYFSPVSISSATLRVGIVRHLFITKNVQRSIFFTVFLLMSLITRTFFFGWFVFYISLFFFKNLAIRVFKEVTLKPPPSLYYSPKQWWEVFWIGVKTIMSFGYVKHSLKERKSSQNWSLGSYGRLRSLIRSLETTLTVDKTKRKLGKSSF